MEAEEQKKMKPLKKIIEKPISQDEVDKIKWLYSGIAVLNEKTRKAALEKDLEFMEKKGKYMSPEEFNTFLFTHKIKQELIPEKYQKESDRYQQMFTSAVSDMLKIEELKDAELGRMLGLPAANENIFELKKKGKTVGFVHFNEKGKTIDFISDISDLPKRFKEKMKE